MFLDKRSFEIIKLLVKNPQMKSTDLERKFVLTKRQITYSINKINQWLESIQLPTIKRSKNGAFILDKQLINHLNESNDSNRHNYNYYIPTERERRILIILYLITKEEEISLAHISDVMKTSKNTVVTDIKSADEFLKDYQLSITYSRITGYDIKGEEINLRKMIQTIVTLILDMYQAHNCFLHFTTLNQSEAVKKIKVIEEKLSVHYTDQSLETMAYVLLLNERRIQQRKIIDPTSLVFELSELKNTKEFQIVYENFEDAIDWPEQEKEWMILHYLTANVQYTQINIVEDKQLISAIKEMIWLFEEKTYIVVRDRKLMINRLLMHLRPAYYRVKYHIMVANNLYEETIKKDENYSLLYDLVTEIIFPIEELTEENFPKSELALLSLFFGAELLEQGITLEKKLRAVVVCSNGNSISKIMKYSLSKIFSNFIFLTTLSVREFQTVEKDFDIVFTTVPLKSKLPLFLVNPLMSEPEKRSLKKQVYLKFGLVNEEVSIKKVMDTIKEHATVINEKELTSDLNAILYPNESIKKTDELLNSFLPSLSKYFSLDAIQFIDEVADWEEAIRIACIPLVKKKIITQLYVETLVLENDQEIVYNFLGKYMAIPHTSPEKGVLSDGFSMLILRKPIQFKNKMGVRIIVPLAIYDQTKHLKAIAQLVQLAEDDEKIKNILASKNVSDVMNQISDEKGGLTNVF